MRLGTLAWIGIGLLALGGGAAAPELVVMATRGSRVGPRTRIASDPSSPDYQLVTWEGGEPAPAAELAAAAGLELEVYTLARIIASEHPRDATQVKVAVAHAVVNNCGRGGIFRTACRGSMYFGRQERREGGKVRYAATSKDPYEQHVQIAAGVYAGELADITQNATNFFSPRAQRAKHISDPTKYRPPEEVDARWRARGLEPVVIAGINPGLVTFYRRA